MRPTSSRCSPVSNCIEASPCVVSSEENELPDSGRRYWRHSDGSVDGKAGGAALVDAAGADWLA